MTLRTRIAAVAGVSVALAVLAVAISLYIAVRSDLRGAVDKGLHARVGVLLRALPHLDRGAIARGSGAVVLFGGAASHGRAGGSHPSAGGGTSIYAFSGFPSKVGPAPFGGASGYVQFIAPNGTRARARRPGQLLLGDRDRCRANARSPGAGTATCSGIERSTARGCGC